MNLRIVVCNCLLFVSLCLPVWAQLSTQVDTIEIQTARIPMKIEETGRNISIVSSEEIQKASYTSLDDLLQYIPGIEVQSRNAFGAQGDISMRGATFSQVLVLIDGMKLNDPLTAHFNSYIPVTPAEIERIEVLRGAAAAMYGADAVGGVINIITKGFSENREDATELAGQVNYGEHKLVNAQQGFSYQRDKLYVGGGFSMNKSDGETIAERTVENTVLEAYDNFFDIKTLGLTVGYRFDNGWALQARTAYDDRNFSARYFYTASAFDKSVETAANWWNQLRVSKSSGNSSTDVNLAYKYNTDEFIFSPDFPSTNNHTTQLWNLNVNHQQVLSDVFSLQVGGQLDRRAIESNDRGDHEDIHAGLYTMGVYRPDDRLNLTGSLRLDYDENYDLEFSPQLNVSYVLPSVTLRASAGRSIRAADYTERYVSFNLQNLTPGRNLGNPDLEAERSWSQEIGLDYHPTPNWTVKATGFFRQSSNLIDYVQTNESEINNSGDLQEGQDYFYASNISDVTTNGLELESWIRTRLSETERLSWSLGYTYLNTSNDEGTVSVYISSHARHLLTTNLIYTSGKFEAALNGLYKSRNERFASSIGSELEADYMLWNARLGVNLTESFGLNVQVHNLLDEDYQDILGAQMPGRWVMGGLRFSIR